MNSLPCDELINQFELCQQDNGFSTDKKHNSLPAIYIRDTFPNLRKKYDISR